LDEQLKKIITATLITLTTLSAISTVWFYIHRITFDEPLFFIAEFLFNIPLIFSVMMFMFLLSTTIGWMLRNK